jgi:hypothetical protein
MKEARMGRAGDERGMAMFEYVVDFEVAGNHDWIMVHADGWELAFAKFVFWCRDNLRVPPQNVSVYRADTHTCLLDATFAPPTV